MTPEIDRDRDLQLRRLPEAVQDGLRESALAKDDLQSHSLSVGEVLDIEKFWESSVDDDVDDLADDPVVAPFSTPYGSSEIAIESSANSARARRRTEPLPVSYAPRASVTSTPPVGKSGPGRASSASGSARRAATAATISPRLCGGIVSPPFTKRFGKARDHASDPGEPNLGVLRIRRRIAVHAAEVPAAFDQWIAHHPWLREAQQHLVFPLVRDHRRRTHGGTVKRAEQPPRDRIKAIRQRHRPASI
jgi:hypothetical protein